MASNSLLPIQENVPLRELCSFKLGGTARYYGELKTDESPEVFLQFAKENQIPVLFLGSGTNLLFPDGMFQAMVIKITEASAPYEMSEGEFFCSCGTRLSSFCSMAVKQGAADFLPLRWIPGTVGGAIKGNAGAHGCCISDFIQRIQFYSPKLNQVLWMKKQECGFCYRGSSFEKGAVLLNAVFLSSRRQRGNSEEEMREYRRAAQPSEPSAGCVFKNTEAGSAGKLIDECGLKGMRCGDACVSPVHANFIVNMGNATAEQVKELISLVKERVKKKYGIELHCEIGFAEDLVYHVT